MRNSWGMIDFSTSVALYNVLRGIGISTLTIIFIHLINKLEEILAGNEKKSECRSNGLCSASEYLQNHNPKFLDEFMC